MLSVNNPATYMKNINEKLKQTSDNLFIYLKIYLNQKRSRLQELTARLNALSPAAILARGYSITRTIPKGIVVKDPALVMPGQNLEVMLSKGFIMVEVRQSPFRKINNH